MITDVHTHILYDIDDGAKTVADSLKMIDMEIENGVDMIVLTPHFDPHKDSIDEFERKCRERYGVLLRHIKAENKKINLILGSETYYSTLLMYYSSLTPLCINGTRYLLLEFAENMRFNGEFFTELEKFMRKFDIVPIVAHVERYADIRNHIKIIGKLKQLGCVIQANAGYTANNIDSKFVKQLFKYSYVDMLASDCHDTEKRPPNLKKAVALINEKYYGYYYFKMFSNSYKTIREKN